MKIHCESIHHYLHWLREKRYFSFAGFSDAEWYCILGEREGTLTALGQQIDAAHGQRLLEILRRRQHDPRFLFAVPRCLWPGPDGRGLPGFAEGQIDYFLGQQGIRIEGYERDMVTDDLARQADLYPLVRQLQDMRTVLIGPAHLRAVAPLLKCREFVEITTPNLHLERGGIERAVATAKAIGGPAVFLVSAGVSAAVIIDQLHDAVAASWFLDCGSIWDAFAGAGAQRDWRAQLYADPVAWEKWKQDCLQGKGWEERVAQRGKP